jgi:hypothetical protein
MPLDDTDPTFVADLLGSRPSVRAVAHWICDAFGNPVVIQPTIVRPSASERFEYADNGDLWIQQRIEVKHRPTIDFKSREEFPYPTVIVDVTHAYDRARPKPYVYVICNQSLTGALVVMCRDTFDEWRKTTKYDTHANREREYYECPVRLCSYHDMTTHARI